MDTREKAEWEGPAALPSYAETLAPRPQPTQNTAWLSINYAARCRLQARPDVRWSHPRRRLPRLLAQGALLEDSRIRAEPSH